MATGQYAAHDGSDEGEWEDRGFTIQDLLMALRRRWWVVPIVFALVVGFSMWRTLRQQRLYRAAVTVRIQEDPNLLPGMMAGAAGGDWRVDRLVSEQMVIKSGKVADKVVERLGLAVAPMDPEVRRSDVFDAAPPPRVTSSQTAALYRVRFGRDAYTVVADGQTYGPVAYGDSVNAAGIVFRFPHRPPVDREEVELGRADEGGAANGIRSMIGTSVYPSTDIVEITYTGTEPVLVRQVVNAVARAYAEVSVESRKTSAQSKSTFIQSQVAKQEERLRAAQDELKRFKERYQTADVSAEQLALASNIAQLEQSRQEVLVERNIYERLIGGLQAADTLDEELRKIVGTGAGEKNQSIANLYTQWFDLQKERAQLLTRLSPNHDDVKAIDGLISRTKRDLQTSSRVYLQALTSRLESIDRTIATQRTVAQRYPPLEAEQVRLMADVKTTQGLYDELQSQYQLAIIAEAAETGQVEIIDSATTPNYAISPNRRRALLTAVIFGLALGLGAAMLLDRLDNSVRSPDEITRLFDVTVLGLIPRIKLSDVNADPSTTTAMNRLVTHADPRSPVAEAYRSLRTNLAFARGRQDLKTLVLTSPGPADGKSTTIANLAITFAQQGQRTLIIDADLRRAVLDKTFSVPRSPGLTDVLVGSVALENAVHETTIPNLFVLGSGQFPPNPSELLGSEAMQAMIEETKKQFDVALFDTPPLLAVTDAAVLSTRVDGTMLVVRMGSTAREAVRRALHALRAVHGRILGVVLNDVDFRAGSYYGGYGYYYSYYYYGESNGNGKAAPNGVMDRLRRLTTVGGRRG